MYDCQVDRLGRELCIGVMRGNELSNGYFVAGKTLFVTPFKTKIKWGFFIEIRRQRGAFGNLIDTLYYNHKEWLNINVNQLFNEYIINKLNRNRLDIITTGKIKHLKHISVGNFRRTVGNANDFGKVNKIIE
ncbi:hypothetical protein [Neobacillus jeddahensis]|uniref:hypothetical protein n=1 Tax=Neobacillus jeddahensis TaxID=1461580 RepID=UPI00058B3D84|nr:hypothetical protein [Neobacillus jeddahensis]